MQCLLSYQWVKLPRESLPAGKGVMGAWTKLASRAAFRAGKATYCGHTNKVAAGSWEGGIVGLKSILGIKNRDKALSVIKTLSELGYISFRHDPKTKKMGYSILDWVVKCSGAACSKGTVYATEGYGFFCLPRNITDRLVCQEQIFGDADALLDLWCHTVWQDPRNALSYAAPIVQFGKHGVALTLDTLGQRWKWEKTKVWRFFKKHEDAFALHKLPGSYGCLVINKVYPDFVFETVSVRAEIDRILGELRSLGDSTTYDGSDNQRINRLIAVYSQCLSPPVPAGKDFLFEQNRVALSPLNIRAYISDCWNCNNSLRCIEVGMFSKSSSIPIRGPCKNHEPRFTNLGGIHNGYG